MVDFQSIFCHVLVSGAAEWPFESDGCAAACSLLPGCRTFSRPTVRSYIISYLIVLKKINIILFVGVDVAPGQDDNRSQEQPRATA